MDAATTALVRELLSATELGSRTRTFGRLLRRSAGRSASGATSGSGLLLVGTPTSEPWHLAAHLGEEATLCGAPELRPTLVRWAPPPGAPAHLAVDLSRLEGVGRRETVFVVAPEMATEGLLQRVADARRIGATVLALDSGDDELNALAHEALVVESGDLVVGTPDVAPLPGIDIAQHLISAAAAETVARRGLRERLARTLDTMVGTPPRD